MVLALGLFIYFLLDHELKFIEKNTKIIKNYLAFVHITVCLTTCILGYFSSYPHIFKSIIFANTGGFFINEVGFFIRERHFTKTNIFLIMHHIVVLIIISNAPFRTYVYVLLSMAEFTNLPGCFLYHFLQRKKEYDSKKITYNIPYEVLQKKIQLIIYFGIRVVISPYFVYQSFIYDTDRISTFNGILFVPIYAIGVFWSMKLYKNYIKLV